MHHHHHHPTHHTCAADSKLMRLATYASVAVALTLVVAKLFAWWVSDSLSMFSSLTDSLFDVATSAMNLIALRYALKPADDDHRFGHTAIEDIVGLAQFAFITASMGLIILQSAERLFNPVAITHEEIGIGVSALGMLLTAALVMFQGYVARKTGSLIIAADRMHYLGDVLFNLGVMAALALALYGGIYWADPVIAIIIAVAILVSTVEIGRRAFDNLMGREMPEAEKEKILTAIKNVAGVHGVHQLRTRYMGTKPVIQMHVDMESHLSFLEAHAITDNVEHALRTLWPQAEVIVHGDPQSHSHAICIA